MEKVYIVCMVAGITVPLISLVFDIFDTCTDATFDFMDFDTGTEIELCFLPLSINAICMASLLFGGFGIIFKEMPLHQRNVWGGVIAYIGACLVQSLLKYLKKSPSYSENEIDLKKRRCSVSNRIAENGYGSIACEKDGCTTINLTAKEENGFAVEQGELIEIIDIKNHIAIVRKKLENF